MPRTLTIYCRHDYLEDSRKHRSPPSRLPLWGCAPITATPTPTRTPNDNNSMSHGFATTDKSTFRHRQGSAPGWHGWGQPLALPDPSCVEALRDAGLDFETILSPVYTEVTAHEPESIAWGDEGMVTIPARTAARKILLPDSRAHVRADTGQVYGLCSSRFDCVQNREQAELGDAIRSDDPRWRVETLFSLYDTSTVVISLSRGDVLNPNRGTGRPEDPILPFLCLANGHGGTRDFSAFGTSVRPLCNNTLQMAEAMDGHRGVKMRHTRSVSTGVGMKEKLQQARTVLASAARLQERFAEAISALARRSMGIDETTKFLSAVYADCFGHEPATGTVTPETLVRWYERRLGILNQWTTNLDDEKQSNIAGTAWGALNAITQWHDHERGRTDDGVRKIESSTFGVASVDKAKTFKRALELVRA